MVSYLLARDQRAQARSIAESMTVLYPNDRLSWLCRADVARADGEAERLGQCLSQAALVGGAPVPYVFPQAVNE
jgi:hypothetical protein